MAREVLDTNVLTIASAPAAGWVHPRIPLDEQALVLKVLQWVRAFREDDARALVLDLGGTIVGEYRANMHDAQLYGRQVVQHKFDTGAVHMVELSYWNNGFEQVACLPAEVEALLHDLGDRKIVAAAYEGGASLVNACDSDWSSDREQQALRLLDIALVQVLTADERRHCRQRQERG